MEDTPDCLVANYRGGLVKQSRTPPEERRAVELVSLNRDLDAQIEGGLDDPVVDDDYYCGIGKYRPKCLQRFATRSWMLFWMCWYCTVQGMCVNGLVPSVLSTIERRFDFTSSILGRIMQSYDIGYVIVCIPVSYFGGRHSKPLFLGLGLLAIGCGSFLFSLPHIVSEPFKKQQDLGSLIGTCPAATLATPAANMTINLKTVPLPQVDKMCENSEPNVSAWDKHKYMVLFCLAHVLHGIGATPLYTIGVSYIDENVKPSLSSLYIAIFYTFAVFGPAFGFLLSASFLRFHTDFMYAERETKITEIDESDPTWVGAWWIGFQLASILCMIGVFPILSFPKILPEAMSMDRARKERRRKSTTIKLDLEDFSKPTTSKPKHHSRSASMGTWKPAMREDMGGRKTKSISDVPQKGGDSMIERRRTASGLLVSGKQPSLLYKLWMDLRHIPVAVVKLLTNPAYMFVTLAAATEGLLITGLSSFMTKYLERQFNVAASRASMLIGCIMVPAAGLGTLGSGYAIKRFHMSCARTLKWCLCMVVLSLVLSPMFLLYCDHSPLVGIEKSYNGSHIITQGYFTTWSSHSKLEAECNNRCTCNADYFTPVCSLANANSQQESQSFYSPCFAGCPQPYGATTTSYVNCTCAPGTVVKKGLCEAKCSGLIGFLVLFAAMCMSTFCVGVPALSVTLRCVADDERSFALGIQWVLIRLIGTIPAPPTFAWLFDLSCVKRSNDACNQGGDGVCFVHNNKLLADLFLAFGLILQTATLVLFVLALIFLRPGIDDENDTENKINEVA